MSELVASTCVGLADLITDGFTYARLASGDIAVPNEGYKAAYVSVLCFGVVTTALSLGYRLCNARLMQAHVLELGWQAPTRRKTRRKSEARRQSQQHEFELAQTHRTKVLLSVTLLSLAVQGAVPKPTASYARAGMADTQVCPCPSSAAILSS